MRAGFERFYVEFVRQVADVVSQEGTLAGETLHLSSGLQRSR
jgi:hypothetical protein